ncbi:MAG: hypothetical protein ACXVPQ_08400, partial [Bacteroidia bacterium]
EKIGYHYEYSLLPDKNYWLIRDCILFSFPKKFNGVQPGVHQYAPIESLLMQHVMNVLNVEFVHDLKAFGKGIYLIIYLFFLVLLPALILLRVI